LDTLKLQAKKQIEEEIVLLKDAGYKLSSVEVNNYNFSVNISSGRNEVKLLVYFGKKGVKKVLQGNKETEIYSSINDLIFGKSLFEFKKNEIDEPSDYIGTDESGKGDFFGPLVVAGVLADKKSLVELKKIGVKDSKELTDTVINNLAGRIKTLVKDKFEIIIINPAKYNELYSKIGNLNRLLAWGHAKVLENILERHHADEAISDKFGDEKLITSSLQKKGQKLILHQYTKAERYTAVAAASILAREKLNLWFVQMNKKYNIRLPKGASSGVITTAKEFISKYGKDELKNIIKLHFKTTKKIL